MPRANPVVVDACRAAIPNAATIEVAEQYGYASLPLCVIDSVFSIGVRYESVRNVIERRSTCPASRVAELTPRGWKVTRTQAARRRHNVTRPVRPPSWWNDSGGR